jgi:hypothetical protein
MWRTDEMVEPIKDVRRWLIARINEPVSDLSRDAMRRRSPYVDRLCAAIDARGCAICGEPLPRKKGRGRPWKYCEDCSRTPAVRKFNELEARGA